jgi:hypothetical protein
MGIVVICDPSGPSLPVTITAQFGKRADLAGADRSSLIFNLAVQVCRPNSLAATDPANRRGGQL